MKNVLYLFLLLTAPIAHAFAPVGGAFISQKIAAGSVGGGLTSPIAPSSAQSNVVVDNQQRQGQTQLYGLFGLGGPEIGVILVAAAFLLGPQKLAELGKDAGKIAGELKEVPAEFQKGIEEGEASAKAMKAKMAETPVEEAKE
eukprot:CAMPEP_0116073902 /NCGR_PEP_ID=MMETSP0322-20121206/15570_1 /TAXON_ID=163516 /ORGANISM="Leptocylindrus danicus var. apora, Strain B651" /LENGTH=142 /DNA_ID=CAMNT_0003563367 /DNA_START=97 /DNA_END=525 /DNA_ORIENTATION=-